MTCEFTKNITGKSIEEIFRLRIMDSKEIRESMHHCYWCWNRFHHGERDKDYLTREQFMSRYGGVSGDANDSAEVRLPK
jgi:hypothetical protein